MNKLETYYHRHLPHYQPSDATFFVTFRLAGSLPVTVIERMRIDRELIKKRIEGIRNKKVRSEEWLEYSDKYFSSFDELLEKGTYGPQWLREPEIARIVQDALCFYDKNTYDLLCYCIMPNHVHMVISVGRIFNSTNLTDRNEISTNNKQLFRILQSIKRYTAKRANITLNRRGAFWQHESYDHVVRDDADLSRIVECVIYNPVRAGLVQSWEEWPWTYLQPL
jgi:REP element-mobilizing transposase RayT